MIYQDEEKKYSVVDGKIYRMIELGVVSAEESETQAPPRTRLAKPGTAAGKYVKGTCGQCGKTGHNKWHCPDRITTGKPSVDSSEETSVRKCKKCGKPGHRSDGCPTKVKEEMNMDELRERVQELRAEGMTSAEVAKELSITLTMVGRVWN